jgi:hypothetical protein
MTEFYTHSGVVPRRGLLITIGVGLGAAILAAIAYTQLSVELRIVALRPPLAVAFGWIIGWIVASAARAGKVRNRVAAAAVGALCGFSGFCAAWPADMHARVGLPQNVSAGFAVDLRIFAAYISDFYRHGHWGLREGTRDYLTGWPLAAVWLCEGAIITAAAAWVPWRKYSRVVFCERCATWAHPEPTTRHLSLEDADTIIQRLGGGDVTVLSDARAAAPEDPSYLRLSLTTCRTCDQTNYLDLERVTEHRDKQGRVTVRAESVYRCLAVDATGARLARGAPE